MQIRNIILLVFITVQLNLFGQVTYYNYSTTNVGPGVVHKKIIAPLVPWTLNVLEIDLTNPYIKMETVKGNDRLFSFERVRSMANRKDYEGHKVVGGVNGDFYNTGTGEPLTSQVINGELLKNPIDWWTIGFSETNQPDIGKINYSGLLVTANGTNAIHGVNKARAENQMILYNSYFGGSTNTNTFGAEVALEHITPWVVNDTVTCVAKTINGDGNSAIPKNESVLSGHGSAQTFITNNIQPGDTVKLLISLQPTVSRLMQLVGGNVKLLQNGVYTAGSNADIHPRTAAGFNEDSTKLVLMTVDGRQPSSRGMSYREMADFMLTQGVKHAVNLDGGGSTTMVVLGDVANSPSDVAGERSVSNGLFTISTAPLGSLSSIQISPDNNRVFFKNEIQFTTTGWDEYFNQVGISSGEIEYTVKPELGSITSEGVFTASNTQDSGYVYVSYNELKDSAWVYIKSIKRIEITPESVVTDTLGEVQFYINPIDVDNLTPAIPLNEYQWTSRNPEIGTISSTGSFRGLSSGNTKVFVTYKSATDSAEISVQIGEGTVVLDSIESLAGWQLSGEYIDTEETKMSIVDSPTTLGLNALKLDYQFIRNADNRSWVILSTDLPVFGLPDSLKLDIKSDLKKHIADFVVSDDNEELFSASSGIFSKTSTEYESYSMAFDKFYQVEPGSNFLFPVRLLAIKIKLGYEGVVGGTNSGTIYLDNLRVVYPNSPTPILINPNNMPRSVELKQNYPNPFNPVTTIEYSVPNRSHIRLEIFNLLGQKVETLVDETQSPGQYKVKWDAGKFSTGIYFYKIQVENKLISKKLVLIK